LALLLIWNVHKYKVLDKEWSGFCSDLFAYFLLTRDRFPRVDEPITKRTTYFHGKVVENQKGVAMYKLVFNGVAFSIVFTAVLLLGWPLNRAASEEDKAYVGSEACQDCHEDEYDKFRAYAKKSHSYDSIMRMKKGLTETEFKSCFECHTTGYGEPGGFRSEHDTPELKNAGCEVCHGPGSLHCESEDPEDILGTLSAEDCERCHCSDRVAAFDYKPLLHGGAH
jgi:hypothetical protein